MKITDALLTAGASHGRTGKAIDPKGIVVHYVANPGSSAMANRNYFENGSDGRGVSSHYIVGLQGEIIRCVPETEVAMHAGAAYGGAYLGQARMNNSIYYGIETCHPSADGRFSDLTEQSLMELCADMCVRHGFDPHKHIFTHNEVTGKLCPLYYVNHPEAWTAFKNGVRERIRLITLPAGRVILSVDNNNYEIGAENIDGRFYAALEDMVETLGGDKLAGIRDVLEANGYTVTWDESLRKITAVRNKKTII